MSRSFPGPLAVSLSVATLWTVPLLAADDILDVIPHDVLGAVVITHPDQVQTNLSELTGKLQLPLPNVIDIARQRSGISEGMDMKGSVAVIFGQPVADEQRPSVVWCVATNDHKKLLESLGAAESDQPIASAMVGGRRMLLASKQGYTLMAATRYRTAVQHILDATDGLGGESKTLSSRMAATDIYAIATPTGITMAQEKLLQGLDVIRAQIERQSPGPANVTAGLAVYETMFRAMDKEFTHLMIGGSIEADGGLRFVKSGALIPGSTLSGMGENAKPMSPDIITDLPSGPFVFAGGGAVPQGVSEYLMGWSMEMTKLYLPGADFSDEDLHQITDIAVDMMRNMRGMSMVMGNAADGAPLYENTTLVMKVNDASGFLENYETSIKQMNEIMKKAKNPPFKYETSRSSHDGLEMLELHMDMSGFLKGQAIPQTQQVMKSMFGDGDKLTVYMAVADEHTILGQYISRERLVKHLKSGQSKELLKDQEGFSRTLALLPKTALGVGFWSPSGMFRMVRRMVGELQPGANAPLPEFPESSPVGMSAALSSERLDIDVVVPADLLTATVQFVQRVRQRRSSNP